MLSIFIYCARVGARRFPESKGIYGNLLPENTCRCLKGYGDASVFQKSSNTDTVDWRNGKVLFPSFPTLIAGVGRWTEAQQKPLEKCAL